MKRFVLFALILPLTSCQSFRSNDPTSIAFSIPNGSTLQLLKNIKIEKDYTHAVIQDGKITTDKDKTLYRISCSLEMKAFGPRTISPDTFTIIRTEDDNERVSTPPSVVHFYTEVYLRSDHNSDIIKLVCSVWGDRYDNHFSVSKMEKSLGDYFSFTFVK